MWWATTSHSSDDFELSRTAPNWGTSRPFKTYAEAKEHVSRDLRARKASIDESLERLAAMEEPQ